MIARELHPLRFGRGSAIVSRGVALEAGVVGLRVAHFRRQCFAAVRRPAPASSGLTRDHAGGRPHLAQGVMMAGRQKRIMEASCGP